MSTALGPGRPLCNPPVVVKSVYLALGDSMSIDKHTGVVGGGAVSQFYRWLGAEWDKIDHCRDGCGIESVPRTRKGDLVTLTIGGNDLHMMQAHYLRVGLGDFVSAHRQLLRDLREANPAALILVGNVYAPQFPLDPRRLRLLDEAPAAAAARRGQRGDPREHPGDRRAVDRHPRSVRRPRGPLALQADRAFVRGRDAAREALPGGVHRRVAVRSALTDTRSARPPRSRPPSRSGERGAGTFDLLGFTHDWGKSRQGYWP